MTKYDYDIETSGIMDYSDTSNVKDGGAVSNEALTLPNYSKLGSYTESNKVNAYVSAQTSNENGVFTEYPILLAEFRKKKNCDGVSVLFCDTDYPTSVDIEWKNKEGVIKTETYNISEPYLRTYEKVEGFTKATFKFNGTNKPFRPVFISKFSFVSLSPYDGFKIVYNGISPGAEDNMMISSDDAEPTLSWLPWVSSGENNNIALPLPNYSILDGTVKDRTNEYMAGFVSEEISSENGTFNTNPKLLVVINDGFYTSTGINLVFDPNGRDYLSEVIVRWYKDAELLEEGTFYPDKNEYFCGKSVRNFNIVEVECVKTSVGYRRAILSRVQIGHEVTYTQKDVKANNVIVEISAISEELTTNTMSFELQGISEAPIFQKNQKLEIYFDGIQQGAFYIKEGSQNSAISYSVKANDAMEMLEGDFYGKKENGSYIAEYDCTLEDFVGYVLDDTNIPYEIEENAKSLPVKGVLKKTTRRQALQQAAFATGAIIDTFGDDKLKIVVSSGKSITLTKDDILSMSVSNLTPCTKCEVTAFSYTLEDTSKVFDDTADGLISFNNPVKVDNWTLSLAVPTKLINAVDATGTVTVNGKKSTFNETVFTKINETVQEKDIDSEIETVTDAVFVNADNVGTVLNRVYGYYVKEKEVQIETYDMNIAPRDILTVELWDGSFYTGVVESVSAKYTNRVYSEVTLR